MTDQPTVTLNDGAAMPHIGQGVFLVPPPEARSIVEMGLRAGYRAVDTAAFYKNEAGVGEAIRSTAEGKIFVTTKLWRDDMGRDAPLEAFARSEAALGVPIDLYLVHWPVPSTDRYLDSWKALVQLRAEGRVRSIGVSNFTVAHLRRIIDATSEVPATNQVELSPHFQQRELVAFHREHGIATTSWSPLGRGAVLGNPEIARIAAKHGRTVAQVIIRWHLEQGFVVIPKASSMARLAENLDVFGFRLDAEDMARIETLDSPTGRIGPDPDSM